MNSRIINIDDSSNIKVQKYEFGRLSSKSVPKRQFNPELFKDSIDEVAKSKSKENVVVKAPKEDKNSELLEKIEVLTSEVVSLQMELDKEKKEHEQALKKVKDESYELGKKDGIKEASETFQNEHEDYKTQLIKSITTLDETVIKLDEQFSNIENELIQSAIFIAKKVIKKELEKNSADVAISISKALVKNLKDATDIKIKVNPLDFKKISEQFSSKSIVLEQDEAVQNGGVVILSNKENIDGTISSRLEKAIELIGKE